MEGDKTQLEHKEEKNYIASKSKWTDFKLHQDIIDALKYQNKTKPTAVQAESLRVTTDEDRKKFNYLIRAVNGAGKTMAFLLPIMNAIQPNMKFAEDKVSRGKVIQNEIFKPQGVILLQNNVLQEQIQSILKQFIQFGQKQKSQKLSFKVGRLDKSGHTPGDIIICQAKSFLNRFDRGNMKLQNCKFVAIDQVDDVYHHDQQSLAKVLQIIKNDKANLITCSATMDKHFINFYKENSGDYQTNNMQVANQETKERVSLQGVNNYYVEVAAGPEMYKYVIKKIFSELYSNTEKAKPQVFIFFNSIDEINDFNSEYQSIKSDHTSQHSQFLQGLSCDTIAAKRYKDGIRVDTTIDQKNETMKNFRNNKTNILLATNIIARGIDVRNAVLAINVGVPKKNQKDQAIDVDTYLHRVGRTGRHNDKGVALTITDHSSTKHLVQGMKKIHNLDVKPLTTPKELAKQVEDCIANNAKS